jgi:hypothetical protein
MRSWRRCDATAGWVNSTPDTSRRRGNFGSGARLHDLLSWDGAPKAPADPDTDRANRCELPEQVFAIGALHVRHRRIIPLSLERWGTAVGERVDLLRDHGEAAVASPAPATSMLFCSVTDMISLITSPIWLAACDSALMRESISTACFTALEVGWISEPAPKSRAPIWQALWSPMPPLHVVEASSDALETTVAAAWCCRHCSSARAVVPILLIPTTAKMARNGGSRPRWPSSR